MIRVKHGTIHTWLYALVASIVLALPANAERTLPLEVHAEPAAITLPPYLNDDLKPVTFDASQHKLTVLHLWATWCVPCQAELPVLDRFAAKHKDVHIIALALNKTDVQRVRNFYEKNEIKHLPIYMDAKMAVFRSLGAEGLPYTLFIDSKGQEVARVEGPANWDSQTINDFVTRYAPH